MKNPVLGSKKAVNQMTLRDIEEAHKNYYAPKNMILTLSGKFSDSDAEIVLEGFHDKRKWTIQSQGEKRTLKLVNPEKKY